MTPVFVDTAYFIARLNTTDQWPGPVVAAREGLGEVSLMMTDEVLGEVLTAFSKKGQQGRKQGAEFVREVLESSAIIVIPQSRLVLPGRPCQL